MRDTYHDDQADWLSNNYASFVLVRPGVTKASLQNDVNAVINKYLVKQLEQFLHMNANDLKNSGNHFIYPVMPLTDIHLHSNKSYEFEVNGNITYVYIFSIIAILFC
jgi:putative ABC transport system permease protein